MKSVFIFLVSFYGLAAFGDYPNHLQGKGKAFFTWEGGVYDRNVDLYLPKDEKGKVFALFSGNVEEVQATASWKVEVGNRTVLNVILPLIPGGEKDTEVFLQGTYLKGKNRALYFGDFYTRKKTPASLPPCGSLRRHRHSPAVPTCNPWVHGGGFQFAY